MFKMEFLQHGLFTAGNLVSYSSRSNFSIKKGVYPTMLVKRRYISFVKDSGATSEHIKLYGVNVGYLKGLVKRYNF